MVSIGDNRTESALVSQNTASCQKLLPFLTPIPRAPAVFLLLNANQNDEYQRDEIAAFC
jgi:hypothetical protein